MADEDEPGRTAKVVALAVVWLTGLATGVQGTLAATAKYGCAPDRHGLGCTTTGSVLGMAVVAVSVLVVIVVTLAGAGRPPRRALFASVIGLLTLALCSGGAFGLLATT